MSLEQAKLFIERMKTDEAFRNKIMTVEDVAERLQLAKTEGYDCTVEEIKSVVTELSDAELEGVAGGTVGGGANKSMCRGWFWGYECD